MMKAMATKQNLISGINDMYRQHEEPSGVGHAQDESVQENRPRPRTFLTGRRRKDDPRPLKTKDDERTSLIVNKQQYAKVRAIALKESMTIKDLVYEMFKLGIERYEKKHGPVDIENAQNIELF